MRLIDPAYLRVINDGLQRGVLNLENESTLPTGLTGIYEEIIPTAQYIKVRRRFLEFFSVWAMLKKEVSSGFVSSLLEWTEGQVSEYIARYSKWFNGSAGGFYTLYHERFRGFILQKTPGNDLIFINDRILSLAQKALVSKQGDEWERYALEHLSSHLLVKALLAKDEGEALKALAYDKDYWSRQIELSKGFDWTGRMLDELMLWASKYDEKSVVECALNKVDLSQLEQNDARRILDLVAANEIETALQRITSFDGNDREGLKRKFILYMLALMELSLLSENTNSNRSQAIAMVLSHFQQHIPVDHGLLDWSTFCPAGLVFEIACRLEDLQLPWGHLFSTASSWDTGWIEDRNWSNASDKRVFRASNLHLDPKVWQPKDLQVIATTLNTFGFLEDAQHLFNWLDTQDQDSDPFYTENENSKGQSQNEDGPFEFESELNSILEFKQGKDKDDGLGKLAMQCVTAERWTEALRACAFIRSELTRTSVLQETASALAKNGRIEEALETAGLNRSTLGRNQSLYRICEVVADSGQVDQSFEVALMMNRDDIRREKALKRIADQFSRQNNYRKASAAFLAMLDTTTALELDHWKSVLLEDIAVECAHAGKWRFAWAVVPHVLDWYREEVVDAISREAVLQDTKAVCIEAAEHFLRQEEMAVLYDSIAKYEAQGSSYSDTTPRPASNARAGDRKIQEDITPALGMNDEQLTKEWNRIKSLAGLQEQVNEMLALAERLSEHQHIEFDQLMAEVLMGIASVEDEAFREESLFKAFGLSAYRLHEQWCETTMNAIGFKAAIDGKLEKLISAWTAHYDWERIVRFVSGMKNDELHRVFVEKLVTTLPLNHFSKQYIKPLLQFRGLKKDQLVQVLLRHTLFELFIHDTKVAMLDRYDRTLQIQWAIDIKNTADAI